MKQGVLPHRNGVSITMKFRTQLIFLAVLLLAAESAYAQKKWPGVVLYSIEQNGITGNLIVDPVVRISNGEFSYPIPTPAEAFDDPNAEKILGGYFKRFCKEEYRRGRKLELYVNGNKCGTAKITMPDTLHSCSPVVSEVRVSYIDSASLHFAGHGLVISGLSPKRPIPKFTVDTTVEKALYEYARNEFILRGVNKDLAEKAEVTDIRATDLNGDGKPEYLVTYLIIGEVVKRGDYEPNMQYSLTLILEPAAGGGFKQLYAHYPDPGIPDETHTYRFTDVLDLDGDGTCEVILQKRNYSSWDYLLLKKKGDVWEEIYEGAGGGC
jgi:hypothetical protein